MAADDSALDPDELAGSLAARRALGAESEQAVIAAFLERTSQAIDERVDERLAQLHYQPPPVPAATHPDSKNAVGLALGSIAMAIPITGIAAALHGATAIIVILVAWLAIAAINISYNVTRRP